MNLLTEEKQTAMVLSEQRENNMEKLVLVKFTTILVIQMVQEFFGEEFWFSALEEWRQIISTNLSVVFRSVFITLEKIENSFICGQVWPTVNNNLSRKRNFSKTL